jgi:hypothetical protein
MPVDYSKFDNIEDSDDEKPAPKEQARPEQAAEKPHCANCHKVVEKPLKCGTCKKVMYCTPQCQREDWQFHKRNCKKPEEPKAKPEPPRKKPDEPKAKPEGSNGSESKTGKKDDGKIEEDEEKLTWYRHREWKPTAEPKQEFKPTQLTGEAAKAISAADKPADTSGKSIWNKADTWEDKDVTSHAKATLKERLTGIPDVDAAGGAVCVTGISDVDGDASKPVIRGTRRHMFDLGFKVNFVFKWMDGSGQQKAEGSLKVADFTNDTVFDKMENEPFVELSFKDAKMLDLARRQAVEAGIGAKVWPAPPGSFMAAVSKRMETWSKEFQMTS